jgi:hypothetical protein
MNNSLKRVATKPVPVELLAAAVEAIGELPEEDRKDMTGRALAIIHLLEASNVPDNLEARSDLVTGIEFRLEALARLCDEASYRAWSMKSGTPEMDYVHGDLIEAAASAPLIMRKRAVCFESKSFFKHVLSITETRGRG